MAKEIKIPIPDQTTEKVRIVSWKKQVGQKINQGEILMEVETDKSVQEVEAMASGTILALYVNVDDMVPVGQVVGFIGEAGEKVEAPAGAVAAAPATAAPAAKAAAVEVPSPSVSASPVARKLAAQLGVDLGSLAGSGSHGKIMRADVEGAKPVVGQGGRILASPNARRLAREKGVDLAHLKGSGPGGRIIGRDVLAAPAGSAKAGPAAGQPQPGTRVALSKMRRAIGVNLQNSFRDIPHFFVQMSVNMGQALAVREELNKGRPKETRVSVNDLVIRAVALALRRFPAVNSRLEEDAVHYLAEVNIGVATALDTGLVVPVLAKADERGWDDLAAEAKRIATEARSGKIVGAGKGTFTISNLGMYGVDCFTAIINPPEAGILAVGAVKNEVVDIGGGIGVRPIMRLTLSSDHRLVDGALAAQFLQAIKKYLEEEIAAVN